MNWSYGDYDTLYDMNGEIHLPNRSIVQVCDWTETLPAFMKEADTLFIDPPWNKGNMNTFYTKAGLPHRSFDFHRFSDTLFRRIQEIAPETGFIEIGKEHLPEYGVRLKAFYKYVTFYNSSYYHNPANKCYVLHATNTFKKRRYKVLEDMDEEDIIKWVCAHHDYECIGDLCMGRGMVGKNAYLNQKRFVGVELNPKRLAVLVHTIQQKGMR